MNEHLKSDKYQKNTEKLIWNIPLEIKVIKMINRQKK